MDLRGSYHSVKEAIYTADWVQKIAGLQTISSCPIIDQIQSGSHRILGRPTIKKDPVTDMLRHLVLKLPSNPSLKEVRSVSLCLTGYAGFPRFDELSSTLCCDIKILDSYLEIFLEKSKAEQLRDGHWIPISRTGKITCPVDALISCIKVGGIDLKGALPVYRAINSAKNAKTPLQRRGLSYTRLRELVLECFIEFPKVNIGVHSLRAGGTTAAANKGVKDRLFKRHGRWVSESAKDGGLKFPWCFSSCQKSSISLRGQYRNYWKYPKSE